MEAKDGMKELLTQLNTTVNDLQIGIEQFEDELYDKTFYEDEKEDKEKRKQIEKLKDFASGIYTWIDALSDIDLEDEVKKYEKTIILDKIKGEED